LYNFIDQYVVHFYFYLLSYHSDIKNIRFFSCYGITVIYAGISNKILIIL